jgi:hypothetical protein
VRLRIAIFRLLVAVTIVGALRGQAPAQESGTMQPREARHEMLVAHRPNVEGTSDSAAREARPAKINAASRTTATAALVLFLTSAGSSLR